LATVAIALIAGSITFLVVERHHALKAGMQNAVSGARLVEEHVRRTFHATNLLLSSAIGITQRRGLDRLEGSWEAHQELAALDQSLPEAGRMWVLRPDGSALLFSQEFPTPAINVADRGYFRELADGKVQMALNGVTTTRYGGKRAFILARRINGPDGSFAGAVTASMEIEYFSSMLDKLLLGPNGSLSVLKLDGKVILREPFQDRFMDISLQDSQLLAQVAKARDGALRMISPLDNRDRLVAFRVLPELGVMVTASMTVEDALAPWWRMVPLMVALVLTVTLVLAVLALFAFKALSREQALRDDLEQRVRQRTEEAGLQAEEAKRANVAKTRFLAAASHDLRQPLQAAGMFVEVLSARVADPGLDAVVEKLRQSIDATNSLLSALLDVSSLESGKVEANLAPIALMPIFANLVDQTEPEASAKGLRLLVAETDAVVHSDPVLLERMLRNLMVNATRYTDRGGILLGARRRGGHMEIQVVDTGRGIPADKLDAIFEDFTRLDTPVGGKRPTGDGLGLGLGVVRRMAGLLGHDLGVKSCPGKGSVFSVRVPLEPQG
jgi:signal transduction histidine kinase